MVNNSTSIDKANKHLRPQHIEHEKDNTMTLEIQILAWYMHNMWLG